MLRGMEDEQNVRENALINVSLSDSIESLVFRTARRVDGSRSRMFTAYPLRLVLMSLVEIPGVRFRY